ncbi:MAG: carbohydrate kinase [Candidatus Omnitrophota bacterium]
METKIVLAIGETLWDLLPSGEALGGAPFNFAYRVNSLGHKGMMVSRLGRDDLGLEAHKKILELGMDDSFMQWDKELPTGTVQVNLADQNHPDFYIVPNAAYDRIEITSSLLEMAERADCVCFGTLAQRSPVSRRTVMKLLEAAGNALKLLDINLRKNCYGEETIAASLEMADILKLNDSEAGYLRKLYSIQAAGIDGFCHEIVQQWSLSHCLVTLGEKGVFAQARDCEGIYVPGFQIELADSCGSGDAFAAGFIARYLEGNALEECCLFGNAFGALTAAQSGATTPIAPEEIEAFLNADIPRLSDPELDYFRVG